MDKGKEIYKKVQEFKPKQITCEELEDYIVIDTRTEKEFTDHHIPSAIHIPLVKNEEHHEVGYLYKQVSPEAAYDIGFNYIANNIPEILDKASKYKDKPLAVYCARGGLRSKTIAYLLDTQGFNVSQLKEGMKAYRNYIQEQIGTIPIPKLIILQGLAGSRKTTLLENLPNKINLELCAKHNSSVFGALDHTPNTQKQFLFELYEQLKKVKDLKLAFIEGEARKIGSVIIPERLWKLMQESKIIFLDVSLDNRAKHFADTYPSMKEYKNKYLEGLISLKKLTSKKLIQQLTELINNNQPFEFWKLILEEYYDSLYQHAFKTQTFEETIDANNFDKTLEYLKNYASNQMV